MFLNPKVHVKNFMIGEGMHVADFGAGTGAHSFVIAEKVGHNGKVYAIELQEELVKKIRAEALSLGAEHIIVLEGDIEKEGGSGLSENSVDRVLISNVIGNSEARNAILDEAKRILKPKGIAIIVDWTGKEHTYEDSIKLAESRGFAFDGMADAGDYHYAVLLRNLSDSENRNEDKRIANSDAFGIIS